MTCQEVSHLLGPFIDGELDSPRQKTISLHVADCSTCAAAVERLRELKRLLAGALVDRMSEVDFTGFWDALERKLALEEARAIPWWRRLREYWSQAGSVPRLALAGAVVAAAFLVAVRFTSYTDTVPTLSPRPLVVASAGRAVRLSRVRASGGTLAVLREPRSDTTVLWVSAEGARP